MSSNAKHQIDFRKRNNFQEQHLYTKLNTNPIISKIRNNTAVDVIFNRQIEKSKYDVLIKLSYFSHRRPMFGVTDVIIIYFNKQQSTSIKIIFSLTLFFNLYL